MLARYQRERLAHRATLRAYEASLRVHGHEVALGEGLLRSVHKSRDAEVAELARSHAEVAKQSTALEAKLEARRGEVKARQEKARWRSAKAQVREDCAVMSPQLACAVYSTRVVAQPSKGWSRGGVAVRAASRTRSRH
jgi:hypothetical protein